METYTPPRAKKSDTDLGLERGKRQFIGREEGQTKEREDNQKMLDPAQEQR